MAKSKDKPETKLQSKQRTRSLHQSRINDYVQSRPGVQFTVTGDEAERVAGFCREGRGLRLWESQDLSTPRGDMLTPGDAGKPHWAYADRGLLQPVDVLVEHKNRLEPPVEWYPTCDRCQGTKVRSFKELADIWKQSYGEALAYIKKPGSNWTWGEVVDGYFPCNYCQGSGHTVRPLVIRAKYAGWSGTTLTDKGKTEALDMCCRLQEHYNPPHVVQWDWDWYGHNEVVVTFYSKWHELLSDYLERVPALVPG